MRMGPIRFLMLMLLPLSGCQTLPSTGLPLTGNPCPFVIDSSLGYSLALPCGAAPLQVPGPSTGLLVEELYEDSAGNLYSIEVAPVTGGGVVLGDQGNLRFEGTLRTASGDTLILATLRLDGADLFRALGSLGDGNLLRVSVFSVNRTTDLDRVLFGTIDLKNTDGRSLLTDGSEAAPTLLAPTLDNYAVLEDLTVWAIGPNERLAVLGWEAGDRVFAMGASRFQRDAFLIRIPDWYSVPVDFVGTAQAFTVAAIASGLSCADVTLSNNAIWSACSDRAVLLGLTPGEQVVMFRRSSVNYLLQLSTGRVALVVQ